MIRQIHIKPPGHTTIYIRHTQHRIDFDVSSIALGTDLTGHHLFISFKALIISLLSSLSIHGGISFFADNHDHKIILLAMNRFIPISIAAIFGVCPGNAQAIPERFPCQYNGGKWTEIKYLENHDDFGSFTLKWDDGPKMSYIWDPNYGDGTPDLMLSDKLGGRWQWSANEDSDGWKLTNVQNRNQINCLGAFPFPSSFKWKRIPDSAQIKSADWDNQVERYNGISLTKAKRIGDSNTEVSYFFYMKGPFMYLEGKPGPNGWSEKGAFRKGDAVFFSGKPSYGSAPGMADVYVKKY